MNDRHALRLPTLVALIAMLVIPATNAQAKLRLPAIIGSNMVLQRDRAVSIWGWADPGAAVEVTIGESTARSKTNDEGRWRVMLDAHPAGGPHEMTITDGTDTMKLEGIMFGEVWVCSGQSNMEWPVRASNDAEAEIAAADHPMIHLFTVANKTAAEPQDDCEGSWTACTPDAIPNFSAVGYFFGRELQQTLNVPIGLIDSTWGGTPAEAWTSLRALRRESRLTAMIENRSGDSTRAQNRPAHLYNAMIHPLIPYGLRGAIWYQGESNAGRADQYETVLPTMIRDWRGRWSQGPFGFHIVQLANFKARQPEPADSDWAELRDAQLMTHRLLPQTGLAVIIDIGDEKDIHPRNKQDVGKRLALGGALATDYGRDVVGHSPALDAAWIKSGRMLVRFSHAGGGLQIRGGDTLSGFAIAGRNREFVWAEAEIIDANTIAVRADAVPYPCAVRYGWADNPDCNLVGGTGLPASPFRTDDWPGVTDGRD